MQYREAGETITTLLRTEDRSSLNYQAALRAAESLLVVAQKNDAEVKEATSTVAKLDVEIRSRRQELAEVGAQIASSRAVAVEAQRKVEALTQEVEKLHAAKAECKAQIQTLKAELAPLPPERAALDALRAAAK
jgi:chromosome segregation ATPase